MICVGLLPQTKFEPVIVSVTLVPAFVDPGERNIRPGSGLITVKRSLSERFGICEASATVTLATCAVARRDTSISIVIWFALPEKCVVMPVELPFHCT